MPERGDPSERARPARRAQPKGISREEGSETRNDPVDARLAGEPRNFPGVGQTAKSENVKGAGHVVTTTLQRGVTACWGGDQPEKLPQVPAKTAWPVPSRREGRASSGLRSW